MNYYFMILMEQPALNLNLLSKFYKNYASYGACWPLKQRLWLNSPSIVPFWNTQREIRKKKKQQSTKKAVFRIKKQSLVKF